MYIVTENFTPHLRRALLSLCAAAASASAFAAPSIPVTVTNSPAVTIANTPTVNANISGPIDAQGSARSAVSTYCFVQSIDTATGNSSCTLAQIPAGKILVVESVLCFAHIPDTIPFKSILLTMGAPNPEFPGAGNQSTVNHFLMMTPTPNGDYGGNHTYMATAPIKLYAFGPPAANGGTGSLWANVQIGPYTIGQSYSQFGCSLAGVLENQ